MAFTPCYDGWDWLIQSGISTGRVGTVNSLEVACHTVWLRVMFALIFLNSRQCLVQVWQAMRVEILYARIPRHCNMTTQKTDAFNYPGLVLAYGRRLQLLTAERFCLIRAAAGVNGV